MALSGRQQGSSSGASGVEEHQEVEMVSSPD